MRVREPVHMRHCVEMPAIAPDGDLTTFDKHSFEFEGERHVVYRKGTGPAVVVITEMPGISPMVLGFADRVVDLGCSVVLPDLYGTAGRDSLSESVPSGLFYGARSMIKGCISRDFSTWALNRTSPIASWLRALARHEHERCGGPGVGAVGMCFSGGFALAMATDPSVLAPIVSQPSLPLPLNKKRSAAVDVSDDDLEIIAGRCSAEGLRVLGLRFDGDRFVPAERFAFLKERLGNGFVAIELNQSEGNPAGLESPLISEHHSVLTTALADEEGEPTREALDQVLDLFRRQLLS